MPASSHCARSRSRPTASRARSATPTTTSARSPTRSTRTRSSAARCATGARRRSSKRIRSRSPSLWRMISSRSRDSARSATKEITCARLRAGRSNLHRCDTTASRSVSMATSQCYRGLPITLASSAAFHSLGRFAIRESLCAEMDAGERSRCNRPACNKCVPLAAWGSTERRDEARARSGFQSLSQDRAPFTKLHIAGQSDRRSRA